MEDEFIPILVYDMVRHKNWHNTCTGGMKGYRRVWRKGFFDESTVLSLRFNSMSLKRSYKFRVMKFILQWSEEHLKLYHKTVWKQYQENHV